MKRAREQRFAVGLLDDHAEIHHRHLIAHMADDAEVVRDEEIGQPERLLQALHQVEDLRLDGHIERRDRLIAHQEFGVGGECPGEHDALALAARELVRKEPLLFGAQAALGKELGHAGRSRLRLTIGHQVERLTDRVAGALARVERGIRILEDHLKPAPSLAQGIAFECADVVVFEPDRSAGVSDKPHHRECGGALARAALAHDAEGGAARY